MHGLLRCSNENINEGKTDQEISSCVADIFKGSKKKATSNKPFATTVVNAMMIMQIAEPKANLKNSL